MRKCPKCASQSIAILLLTYYNLSLRCNDCTHRWTISNEAVTA